jgi:DNA-binding transcriptional LysR family regulator
MELRHLRYFLAVAEELSFSRAAGRLAIAQPPLSRQIQALEEEIGVPLLVRTKRRVLLTDSGRVFLEGARSVLAQAARAIDEARRASRGETGSLSVAFAPSAEIALMRPIVRAHTRAHRKARLEVHTCVEQEAVRAVRLGAVQVAILPAPPSREPEVRVEPLASLRLRVAMAPAHRLARRSRVPLRQLAGEAIVLFARGVSPALHDAVASAFRSAGVPLDVTHEADQLHTCLGLVAAGLGVTLLPAALGVREPVVFRPLDPTPPALDFVAMYREDLSADAIESFLRTARAALRTAADVAGRV